jgi:hypothetical protein
MKNLFEAYEAAKQESDAIDAKLEAEPENEAIEAEFDAAYKKYFDSFMKLSSAIVRFSNNKIDEKTARLLINTKYDAIKELLINC